ncbi:hypothetical protein P280DRAFT_100339 [Massarina eburnea CBS 473.64]|uniref:Uncharacterized protein n=1 Tax=Massarina eburnea CBS 473.64 TaxID=1395130 RepID=A0A6A6RSH9_9PLEO|nr:hypothetical protein P280DRAFT_100339 [Massarina eburnea CBS 473.64]
MPTSLLPTGGIALVGAPDSDIGSRVAKPTPIQAMHVEMTQDIVDELLGSLRSGQPPQLFFGRTPYGDKTHPLATSSENGRYELYQTSGAGNDDDDLEFSSLINHSLIVEKAGAVTAGVDTALEQLKSSMAAISELKQANKTIVGNNTTPIHRRVPSKNFAPHLTASGVGSPLLSVPSSPMTKRAPTSQPSNAHDAIVNALRMPLIHLLAVQPSKEAPLANTCRAPSTVVRDLLPKIAKRCADDSEKWQLTDRSFRELNPYKFPYKTSEDREQAINGAIKSFDRLRLTKDDKLWQILLPREERGQGKCLSRLNVKAPEPKAAKPSTPLHRMPKLNDKKAVAKKAEAKDVEKKAKEVKETEPKPKRAVKEKVVKEKVVKEKVVKQLKHVSDAPAKAATPKVPAVAPTNRYTPSETNKPPRNKKPAPAAEAASSPRAKPKMSARDLQRERERAIRPAKSAMPVNTKPKNPSPLSASPPVNASDFEDNHPVHKALAAAASPKTPSGNSDRGLKRKANDIDSDIHNHNLSAKKSHVDRNTPNHTPSSANGRLNGTTPSTNGSLKRKPDESSTSNTPTTKTSPSVPSLSFRQTVELSQKFQKYYKKYEDLYWQLTESETPPTEAQRNDLLKMHKKLEEMKREIKAGARAGVHR